MKHLPLFIVALLTPVLIYAADDSPAGASAAAGGAKPPVIVCFGDSITKSGYPEELAGLIKAEVINAGVPGNTTRAALTRMATDVLARQPGVVVICFGANDSRLAEPEVYVPVAQYEANLTTMVEACKERAIRAVICTMPPIQDEPYFQRHAREKFEPAGGLQAVIETYRNAALRVAEAQRIPCVDLNRLLAAQPAWQRPDGVHPSEEGNRIIARLVAEAVRALIAPVGDSCERAGTK